MEKKKIEINLKTFLDNIKDILDFIKYFFKNVWYDIKSLFKDRKWLKKFIFFISLFVICCIYPKIVTCVIGTAIMVLLTIVVLVFTVGVPISITIGIGLNILTDIIDKTKRVYLNSLIFWILYIIFFILVCIGVVLMNISLSEHINYFNLYIQIWQNNY